MRCQRGDCEREAQPGLSWCRVCEPTSTDREDELALALIRMVVVFIAVLGCAGLLGWWL